jgi:hypothetical protein
MIEEIGLGGMQSGEAELDGGIHRFRWRTQGTVETGSHTVQVDEEQQESDGRESNPHDGLYGSR